MAIDSDKFAQELGKLRAISPAQTQKCFEDLLDPSDHLSTKKNIAMYTLAYLVMKHYPRSTPASGEKMQWIEQMRVVSAAYGSPRVTELVEACFERHK